MEKSIVICSYNCTLNPPSVLPVNLNFNKFARRTSIHARGPGKVLVFFQIVYYWFTPCNVMGFFKVLMERAGYILKTTVFGVGWTLKMRAAHCSETSEHNKYSAPCKDAEDNYLCNTVHKNIWKFLASFLRYGSPILRPTSKDGESPSFLLYGAAYSR